MEGSRGHKLLRSDKRSAKANCIQVVRYVTQRSKNVYGQVYFWILGLGPTVFGKTCRSSKVSSGQSEPEKEFKCPCLIKVPVMMRKERSHSRQEILPETVGDGQQRMSL